MIKKPRRKISGALHMLCQHEEKTKTRCPKSRAKLSQIARRVSHAALIPLRLTVRTYTVGEAYSKMYVEKCEKQNGLRKQFS